MKTEPLPIATIEIDETEEITAPLVVPPELRDRISPLSAQFRAVTEKDLEPPAAIIRVRPLERG